MSRRTPRDLAKVNKTCPKWGKPYLYIKDWKGGGALFVHGYDTDAPSGLKHKLACHVPGPVALRLM